ncbi:MAG: sugar phosphate isomerase/epimerase [Alistipes sp.]|jgi:sugar phosphate isomerase/epimerase|nr:sugar phosphate isomerase/epimerase [Alistipes sp.]MBQ1958650.1 sugar phosphate isomerase/epimerase [Alistipes sp.]MBQ1981364.1 sugar phosphate isomerase/epimerase [Alistipes sp.]MBQ2414806.1 sugar phosphate isomerase/epimerase [Alistipes sp.]MBQ5623628.1 sugar phosphate isomerase/epimerase [Alistipes sp.]
MNRKEFLQRSLAGAAVVAAATAPVELLASCAPKKGKPELRLSFQEGTAPGKNLNEKFDYMEKLGIVGFEPGGRNLANRVTEIQNALKGRNIKLSAICAGFGGFILAEDPAVKATFDSTMRDIIAAAGELGSTGVIMVPAFNGQKPCKPHTRETREYLCEQMHELGEYALKHNTTVILEPLNRGECHYLRLVSDGAAIARDSKSAGVKVMGDFWHMKEETNDYAALLSAGEYLQHVHVASRGRRSMPGEDGEKDNYIDGFRALKEMNYPYYVSFECGCQGDRNVVLPAAVELLREQWKKA